jgi:predicted NAD/FAD-binding protein
MGIDNYVIPVCAAVWSCPSEACLDFPCEFILEFMRNHHLLQLSNRPQWLTVAGRSSSKISSLLLTYLYIY